MWSPAAVTIEEDAMPSWTRILLALSLILLPAIALAADTQRFDGEWQTTVSCAAARDALGYSYGFVSTVKDGVLHGVHGTAGEPGSLQIDGKIGADGVAKLYADGRTGSKEYVPGRDTPRGTEYGYNIDAKFEGSTGTGTRLEGRSCTLQFEKQ
jgi:hypothetical protein